MQLDSSWTIRASADISHPNRLPFEGFLTILDVASDKAPSGARGHRVILTKKAAEASLDTLIGMAVDFKAGWDGHDARQKCGVIEAARIEENKIMVKGYIFARDFQEFSKEFGNKRMGMSYELADAHVADMRASVWTLTKATFTGAAILYAEKAAYRNTSFTLKGSNEHNQTTLYNTTSKTTTGLVSGRIAAMDSALSPSGSERIER